MSESSEALTTASLKALFKFPFQGPDWRNRFITGAAIMFAGSFVPIVPTLFTAGYALQIMRQAIKGEELALPAWNDLGKLGLDGLRLFFVSLVYMLPGYIVMFGGMGLYFIMSIAAPLFMANAEESVGAVIIFIVSTFASMIVMFIAIALGMALLLLGAIPLPAAIGHMAAQDKVGAAFRVREWWAILRANKLGYFIAWVIIGGLLFILSLILTITYYTIILCFLIPFLMAPIGFYLSLVTAAVFGHTYRESTVLLKQ